MPTRSWWDGPGRWTRILIGSCVLLHLVPVVPVLGLARPGSWGFEWWQPITYGFVHGSWLHLLFNMLGLWLFGPPLEAERGQIWFLETYFISVLWAAILHVIVSPWLGSGSALIGASGGLYGLMVAYAWHYPEERLPLLPGLDVQARVLALVYAGVELYLLFPTWLPGAAWLDSKLGHVAHVAHLGGMLGGWMLGRRPSKALMKENVE